MAGVLDIEQKTVQQVLEKAQISIGKMPLAVTLLGQGEANTNWLITLAEHRFVLRVGRRGQASVGSLKRELEAFAQLPKVHRPNVFNADFDQDIVAAPYLLLNYIEGQDSIAWTGQKRDMHARQLARLHAVKSAKHGDILTPSAEPLDLLKRFEQALEYWHKHAQEMFLIDKCRQLIDPVRAFIQQYNDAFLALKQFSLIHGDLHSYNILFDGKNVRYIDWEQVSFGDPALDIAQFSWDVETYWQAPISAEQLSTFVSLYCDEGDCQLDKQALLLRRDVWMVYTMFFDQIYHRTQIAKDTTGKQEFTVKQIEKYLEQRFLKSD